MPSPRVYRKAPTPNRIQREREHCETLARELADAHGACKVLMRENEALRALVEPLQRRVAALEAAAAVQ